ncbi:MAG: S-methyl-5-thioribose-1-phosphate isomerase [Anaerolineales bacterium]|jgi:methylthioribose-1-phosphate isomerase
MRTLEWDSARGLLRLIDQRRLPGELRWLELRSSGEVAEAIRDMAVRGAPAIGVAAAFGLVLACRGSPSPSSAEREQELRQAAEELCRARPTAVNLRWAVERMLRAAGSAAGEPELELGERLLLEAQRMAEEDIATNRRMAGFGADLLRDGDTVLHHCNTGALATVDYGTALGVIRAAHDQGKRIHVLVDETRPRLQGARLTAWELQQLGIPFEVIVDGAAGHFLHRGEVQAVLVGADRVAANGDLANKVGTYMLALAAHENHVPFYAVVPTSSIDLTLPDGRHIPIEEREEAEVLDLELGGERVTPPGIRARNPAFDITPQEYLTAWITECGLILPPFERNAQALLGGGATA